jgi:hypothetical protein
MSSSAVRRRIGITFVLVAGAVLGLAGPANAGAAVEVLEPGAEGPYEVSAYGGVAAWPRYDTVFRRPKIIVYRDGHATTTAVEGADLDVGPDAHGRPVVVYVRGRRIYSMNLAGTSRKLLYRARHGDVSLPTIWGKRLAFFSERGERPGRANIKNLSTHRVTSRAAGSNHDSRAFGGPVAADLRGSRLAFSWAYPADCDIGVPADPKYPETTLDEVAVLSGHSLKRRRLAMSCSLGYGSVFQLRDGVAWTRNATFGIDVPSVLRLQGETITLPHRRAIVAFDGSQYFISRFVGPYETGNYELIKTSDPTE